jgi:large subunit ribosomal protein L18
VNHEKTVGQQRLRRRRRVRRTIRQTSRRPRLCVFRSHKHIYCQVIDDSAGRTLASASSRDKNLQPSLSKGGNKEAATIVGQAIAQRSLEAGIKEVCLDRGRYKYHGRVAALADAAREAGLAL